MSGDVEMFLGDVKEKLEWPSVWNRLHQLYPVNNRITRSYVFPLYTVIKELSKVSKAPKGF